MDSASKATIRYCFEGSKVVTLMYSINETNNTIRYAGSLFRHPAAFDEEDNKLTLSLEEIFAIKAQNKVIFKRGSDMRKSHYRTVQHRYEHFPVYVTFPASLREKLQQLREIKVPKQYGEMHRKFDKKMKKYLRHCMGDKELGVCIVTPERRQQLNMKRRESKQAQKSLQETSQKMPVTRNKTVKDVKDIKLDAPLLVENVTVTALV